MLNFQYSMSFHRPLGLLVSHLFLFSCSLSSYIQLFRCKAHLLYWASVVHGGEELDARTSQARRQPTWRKKLSVSVSQCPSVPLSKCPCVTMSQGFCIAMSQFSNVPISRCYSVSVLQYTFMQIQCTRSLYPHCPIVPVFQCSCILISLYPNLSLSLYPNDVASKFLSVPVIQYPCIAMSLAQLCAERIHVKLTAIPPCQGSITQLIL